MTRLGSSLEKPHEFSDRINIGLLKYVSAQHAIHSNLLAIRIDNT